MAMSDYLEEMLIDAVYRSGSFTAPTTYWAHLYNTDPGDDGGTDGELTGGDYAPIQFTLNDSTSETTGYRVTNNGDITFPTATSDWSTINFIAIYDGSDASSANLLDYGAITTARTVLTDGIFKILDGELKINYN